MPLQQVKNKTKQQKFIGNKHVGKRVLGLAFATAVIQLGYFTRHSETDGIDLTCLVLEFGETNNCVLRKQ